MNVYQILNNFEREVSIIEASNSKPRDESIKLIKLCQNKLAILKKLVLFNEFNSLDEEINFFKNIKPVILSVYFFHTCKLKYLVGLPSIDKNQQIKFILKEINQKKKFIKKHYEFSVYIETGQTSSDHIYFLRKNVPAFVKLDNYKFIDYGFITNKDIILAKINAFKKFKSFLQIEFYRITGNGLHLKKPLNSYQLEWTASKSALVELIYALFYSNAINDGKIEIKQIAALFEAVFNIEIGDIYKIFSDIKFRQKSPTKFLDELTLKLRDEIDKNYR